MSDVPLVEVVKPCAKCGCDDVLVRWHEKRPAYRQAACRDSMSVLDYGKRPESYREHLHFHCRRCQYDWIGSTADSGAAE